MNLVTLRHYLNSTTANAFGSTFAFLANTQTPTKNTKELPSQRTTTTPNQDGYEKKNERLTRYWRYRGWSTTAQVQFFNLALVQSWADVPWFPLQRQYPNRYGAVVPKLRRWKQLENKHLFPQKLTKQKRENWNLSAETWKLESEKQKLESWNLSVETWKV